ncbi:MAG: hypothetical protein PVSMB4_08500 [Ktedonobacterales bacterium]
MRGSALRTMWALFTKDLRVWIRRPATAATTLIPPLAFLLVGALAAAAVGRSPVALVNQDDGPQGARIVRAIEQADVFQLREVDATRAQALLRNLDVVAVIIVPAGFTQRLAAGEPTPINVTVNNLNLDFTNDIRRAVPDAITQYYQAQGDASPIKVTPREQDLRQHDVELYQYEVLPTILLLLMVGGLVNGGQATAREWESLTVKELLLAPVARSALIGGKVLAGFVTTFGLGALVLLLTDALGWIHPEGVYWLSALLVMALVALFSSGLGVAVGALIQRIQPVIAISINLAIYMFFLAGGIGVLAFEPDWLQQIAAFVPLTYGDHGLEMAVFYHSADLLSRDIVVLLAAALAAVALGVVALRRGSAR